MAKLLGEIVEQNIERIVVSRTYGEVVVALLPHKDGSGWSFVNLTKGHICPCKFDSKENGMKDLDFQHKVISYRVLKKNIQTNADRIRAMSDEELADLLCEAYNAGCDDATAWEYGSRQNTFIWDEEWLKHPAEQKVIKNYKKSC